MGVEQKETYKIQSLPSLLLVLSIRSVRECLTVFHCLRMLYYTKQSKCALNAVTQQSLTQLKATRTFFSAMDRSVRQIENHFGHVPTWCVAQRIDRLAWFDFRYFISYVLLGNSFTEIRENSPLLFDFIRFCLERWMLNAHWSCFVFWFQLSYWWDYWF